MAPIRVPNPVRTQRKSSVTTLAALASIKAAGPSSLSAAVTFAPNVTPVTYVEEQAEDFLPALDPDAAALFPAGESLLGDPAVKRSHASRKKGDDHIPRPPNAFMLFRAHFVKQRHVPGSIDTASGSLSKIIGTYWRNLPLNEKRVWEIKAKQAKLEHKHRYPNYRFRPVHNKAKKAGPTPPPKPAPSARDEARVEGVARLLLAGQKGDELARSVRAMDDNFQELALQEQQQQQHAPYAPAPSAWPHGHRRSSSVPPSLAAAGQASNIALPSLPFLQPLSRPRSPPAWGAPAPPRRPSSVPPFFNAPWLPAETFAWSADPVALPLAADVDLPDADTSLFEPAFFGGGTPFAFGAAPPAQAHPAPLDLAFAYGPEPTLAPHELPTPASATLPTPAQDAFGWTAPAPVYSNPAEFAPAYGWAPAAGASESPAYSGSPTPSEPEAPYAPQYTHDFGYGGYAPAFAPEPLVAPAPEFQHPFAGADFAPGVFDGAHHAQPLDASKFNPRDFRMSGVDFNF